VTKVIREEMIKFLESDENESTTLQSVWDSTNAMQRGKFIAVSVYIKKIRDLSNNQSNYAPQDNRKTRTS
jgi:hypothetical protein